MASIHWTVGARQDLGSIVEYIGRDSPTYAAAMAERLVSAVRLLRRYPRLGRIVPEYEDDTLRELLVGNYRIVYRTRARRVGIVAIVHGSRQMRDRLPSEPWDFA